jgi:hypothetical protein
VQLLPQHSTLDVHVAPEPLQTLAFEHVWLVGSQ